MAEAAEAEQGTGREASLLPVPALALELGPLVGSKKVAATLRTDPPPFPLLSLSLCLSLSLTPSLCLCLSRF